MIHKTVKIYIYLTDSAETSGTGRAMHVVNLTCRQKAQHQQLDRKSVTPSAGWWPVSSRMCRVLEKMASLRWYWGIICRKKV